MKLTSKALAPLAAALFAGFAAWPLAPITRTSVTPPRFGDIRLSTGVRLHYAEQGPENGEPIILLHGYSDSWFSYSRVLPLFSTRYRAFALTMRGHGDSDRPPAGYHMGDLAADVIAFMDAKRIVRATVVGHSMGGVVAQQVALAAPRRVSRLVLAATATSPRNIPGIYDFEKEVNALPEPVPEKFVREFQMSTVSVPVPDEFLGRVIEESRKLPARVWREVMRGMIATDPAVALGRSGISTLIMWGDKDAWFPRATQDSLVAMIGTARLRVYANTGHTPHWERPREFVKDVERFLAER